MLPLSVISWQDSIRYLVLDKVNVIEWHDDWIVRSAPVKITQPNYVGYIEVTVTAPNAQLARQLLQAQYGVPLWQIGSVKEVK
jgi:hypothetical protein